MKNTKVCIIGAGPAGAIASLFLAKKGIPCLLVDKMSFPRDKICGDGISGWVLDVLEELDPEILLSLSKKDFVVHSRGLKVAAPNGKSINLPFSDKFIKNENLPAGFIAKRMDFDNFLIEEVRKKNEIELIEGVSVSTFINKGAHVYLADKEKNFEMETDLVIFANGARSKFMKDPGGILKTKSATMIGVKAYYKGVSDCHPQNFIELHFLKEIIPGYFWIFPLPNGMANIGMGLDQHRIKKRKINLAKLMLEVIASNSSINERFKNAEMVSGIEAYGLPLWDKKQSIAGDRYMLCGDAASLIDPFTGEGVGHAVLSGMFAARQAERSLIANRFDAEFMGNYEKELYDRIGKELKISKNITRFLKYPRVFNFVMNKTLKNDDLREYLTLALSDLDVRKKLKSPFSYLKMLFK